MLPLNPTNLASSLAQGVLQQSQVSKAQDAQRSNRARQKQALTEKEEKETDTVEDSFETSDEHLAISDDSPSNNQSGDEGEGEGEDESGERAVEEMNKESANGEMDGISHLDIKA